MISDMTTAELLQQLQRHSEEQSRVRMEGPRFLYLDEIIKRIKYELNQRGIKL